MCTKTEKRRGHRVILPKTLSHTAQDGGFISLNLRGPYVNWSGRRGMFRPEPHDPTSTARIRSSLLYTSARFLALGCQINGPDHQTTQALDTHPITIRRPQGTPRSGTRRSNRDHSNCIQRSTPPGHHLPQIHGQRTAAHNPHGGATAGAVDFRLWCPAVQSTTCYAMWWTRRAQRRTSYRRLSGAGIWRRCPAAPRRSLSTDEQSPRR